MSAHDGTLLPPSQGNGAGVWNPNSQWLPSCNDVFRFPSFMYATPRAAQVCVNSWPKCQGPLGLATCLPEPSRLAT